VTPEADLLALAQRDERLTNMGVRIPQRYFYETYKVPEPQRDEPVAEPRLAPQLGTTETFGTIGTVQAVPIVPAVPALDPHAVRVSEHAEQLALAALPRGLDAYAGLVAELVRELTAASTYDAAIRRLPDALLPEELAPFGEGLYAALLTANLAARGTVIVEAAEVGAQVARMAAPSALPFEITEPLPPEEAIAWFNRLRPITARGFADLADSLRSAAFRVARVESQGLITAVKDALGQSLSEGTTFRDFLKGVNQVFDRAGVTRLNPYHAETVFRTNVKTAYEQGREEQFLAPDVVSFFPFWQWHAVMDGRLVNGQWRGTRPNHAAMNSRIYRVENPIWQVWQVPAGFNCRCTRTAISVVEARAQGIQESELPPAWVQPDRGFAGGAVLGRIA
jgi:SPP1 gp7 family putative phage head morphogenesis protein